MSENINFGITKDTRSEGTKLFNPPIKLEQATKQFPNKYKFPNAVLVNVVADPKKETKNGEQEVVQFIFKGSKGEVYTHTEWSIDTSDEKFSQKLESLNSRIKHILEQVGLSLPENGIGAGAKNFAEFFEDVAKAFNSQVVEQEGKEGEEPKRIKKYFLQRVYLKLTYYKTNLSFPMFPDFIQKATNEKGEPIPCNLTINPSYDKIEPESSGANTFNNVDAGGGGDLGDLPDFD